MRILFLDDDPRRASTFASAYPLAVWVTTVEECLTLLEEPWDEVHLDHDLGGETYVDTDRDDSGMAVVRWLCFEFREHLRTTRFFVHSHNENAACIMALHLEVMGYQVKAQPFAPSSTRRLVPSIEARRRDVSWAMKVLHWLSGHSRARVLL